VCKLYFDKKLVTKIIKKNLENAAASFDVRKRKLDLPVNTARPEQSRIERLYTIGCKNNFDITS
jgi:hypothetical protein